MLSVERSIPGSKWGPFARRSGTAYRSADGYRYLPQDLGRVHTREADFAAVAGVAEGAPAGLAILGGARFQSVVPLVQQEGVRHTVIDVGPRQDFQEAVRPVGVERG